MSSFEFLNQWAMDFGFSLLHFVWQGAVLGMILLGILRLFKHRAPQLRYTLACMGLVCMAALPIVNFMTLTPPKMPVASVMEGVEVAGSNTQVLPVTHMLEADETLVVSPPMTSSTATQSVPAPTTYTRVQDRPNPVAPSAWYEMVPWLAWCWMIGVFFMGLRDVTGAVLLRRIRRNAHPVDDTTADLSCIVQLQMGLDRPVPVMWSETLSVAAAIGWISPMVLLPMSLSTGVSPNALRAIIAHEVAHIQRYDMWVNLVQRFIETLLFFHPLVWMISNEIRKERELCCDDAAVGVCPDRAQYVHGLLAMAEANHPATALAMSAHGGDLAHRVSRILNPAKAPIDSGLRTLSDMSAILLALAPLMLCFISITAKAEESAGNQYLNFPEDHSVGTIYARWADRDYREQAWMPDHALGWTSWGEAKGEVIIPENHQVKLETSESDISFLNDLKVDALFFLDCTGSELSDEGSAPIGSLTGLRALDISHNRELTDAGIDSLGDLDNLEWLAIEKTGIAGDATSVLEGFKELRYFDAWNSKLSDEGLRQLSTLQHLEWLGIENTHNITQEGFKHLLGMDSLRGLMLENCQLDDVIFNYLGDKPNLLYLDMRNNNITDQGLLNLGLYPSLLSLNLSKTSVTNKELCELGDIPQLETLNLGETKVTAMCKEGLLGISKLRTVGLSHTILTEAEQRDINIALSSRVFDTDIVQTSSNPNAPKVGVFISHFSATGPSSLGRPYGYHHQYPQVRAQFLNEANFDVYAIIEPDTEFLGELPAILRESGLSTKLIDATDTEALKELDVIFASRAVNLSEEVLGAFNSAVSNGVGMVIHNGYGSVTPGDNSLEAREKITGFEGSQYSWRGMGSQTFEILSQHPIMGQTPIGTKIKITASSGERSSNDQAVDGQVLIGNGTEFPNNFPSMYVRTHGKGRIVICQWHRLLHSDLPFGKYGLYIRSVNWAAKRDVDSVW